VEYLTDEIENRSLAYLKTIDEMGGALAAIENGYVQGEIQEAAYAYQRSVESGEEIVVGVNAYQVGESVELERLKVDPAIEEGQRAHLAAIRQRRDASRVSELLASLENAARGSENLVPLFITLVEADATLGEICGVLRQVWGEYQPPTWL
jgi:methylmalonyl-CoA mutase N-terminal domain/subunit